MTTRVQKCVPKECPRHAHNDAHESMRRTTFRTPSLAADHCESCDPRAYDVPCWSPYYRGKSSRIDKTHSWRSLAAAVIEIESTQNRTRGQGETRFQPLFPARNRSRGLCFYTGPLSTADENRYSKGADSERTLVMHTHTHTHNEPSRKW